MDKEQLLQNLSELEMQLKGVKSATEQIDLLIKNDKQMLQSVTNFLDASNNNVAQEDVIILPLDNAHAFSFISEAL